MYLYESLYIMMMKITHFTHIIIWVYSMCFILYECSSSLMGICWASYYNIIVICFGFFCFVLFIFHIEYTMYISRNSCDLNNGQLLCFIHA